MSSAPNLILHHYDTSPFSEKVRVMLGIKGLAWRSVIQPVIMPKPDLTALTGGYRRIPVLQVGADIYCDSQVILAEIERRAPSPKVARGADWAVNLWADRSFFQATVAVVFGAIGERVPAEFIKDREALSGRPFDLAAMRAAAVPMQGQWRAHASWIEQGLADGPYLGGQAPSLADVSAYMNIWWLSAAAPHLADRLLEGLPKAAAWSTAMRDIGHGQRSELDPKDALAIARAAQPDAARAHDPADPLEVRPGAAVRVAADDYGRDPIVGVLVAATSDRLTIARDDPATGPVHVHFPRIGYVVGLG